ncbi:MAG: hypothetical protein MJ146_02580 [Clostridia bacterium]|nr:hypothetical protein [Clostridia bacterium]
MKTVGFPMIRNFSGDSRDFNPALFEFMDRYEGVEFYLEDGYGSRLGYTKDDYYKASSKVKFVSRKESFGQDITMILKNPELEDLEMLKDGSVYFSMLHYATRPGVREIIERKHLKAFAMDHIVDDEHKRIFVDFFGTAFNACKYGVDALKETYPKFHSKDRGPIKALVMGVGGVGQNAIRSLEILSDQEFLQSGEYGILPIVATRAITGHPELFNELIKDCYLVVDATQRKVESEYVMTNEQIGLLPEEAVIVDICADRYDFTVNPPLVKGMEGTLTGSPDHAIIYPDDPRYETEFPADIVSSKHRRVTASCNAWPGMDVPRSVQVYFGLMKNYVGLILTKEFEDISEDSDNLFERGLARSTYEYYLAHK